MKSNYKQCALRSDVSSTLIITAEQFGSGASIIQQLLITFSPWSTRSQLTSFSFFHNKEKSFSHLNLKENFFFFLAPSILSREEKRMAVNGCIVIIREIEILQLQEIFCALNRLHLSPAAHILHLVM